MILEEFQQYRVSPDAPAGLDAFPPDPGDDLPESKSEGKKELRELQRRLTELQQRFFVAGRKKFLVVLQGLDTAGKNGTIRHVFRGVNPQGVHVASFEKPTRNELAHDYLRRVHQRAPANGEVVIFDRSHYEDVTAVRVNNLQPESVWSKRFRHINEFERMLVDEGTAILKIYLHIDRATQKKRLQSRLDKPSKRWKFDHSDLVARELWDDYIRAYNDVFARTSTHHAPWHVVPANKKWARNLLVARMIAAAFEQFNLDYPEVDFDPNEVYII